ncbi:hypothetical protein J3Q64DRAFT_1702359 [Phycomyces blakesleeanus]|uniref:Uncharacterized protein n=1 Tax=Phycomyces blakesleeanus TaxID=4837 RepID=A0ABR3ARW8_PHYBL
MILIYKADFIINKRIIKNYFYHYETPLVTRTGLHLEPEVLPEGQEDHVYNLWLEREQERTIDLDTKFGDKVKHLPESTKPSLDDKVKQTSIGLYDNQDDLIFTRYISSRKSRKHFVRRNDVSVSEEYYILLHFFCMLFVQPFLLLLVAFELRLNKRYLPVRTPIQFKLESSSKM